jgi:hypothetical protein
VREEAPPMPVAITAGCSAGLISAQLTAVPLCFCVFLRPRPYIIVALALAHIHGWMPLSSVGFTCTGVLRCQAAACVQVWYATTRDHRGI